MDSLDLQAADGALRAMEDLAVRLQTRLTAVPAVGPDNGGDGEAEKAALLEDLLAELGLPAPRRLDAPDDRVPTGVRPNLVSVLDGPGPTLWVLTHMDVVPTGDPGLWDSDPWTVRREGDRIYGRGVEDNQQGMVASLLAAHAAAQNGGPARRVGLILVSDEETGSRRGLSHVLEADPGMVSRDDLVLVPDGGNEEGTMLEVAEKSILWMRLEVEGEQCHGSMPAMGVNAAVAAAAATVALADALPAAYPDEDPLFDPPGSTFAPTRREENQPNVNMVPGKDISYLDCRLLPGVDPQGAIELAARVASDAVAPYGATARVEAHLLQEAPPATPADAPIVGALEAAIREVTGKRARPMGIGGGTVAAMFRARGIPAVVWSTLCWQAHQPNEWCSLENLMSDARVMLRLMA